MKYLIMGFLLVCVVYDIKEQKIPTLWLTGNLIVGVIYRLFLWKGIFVGDLLVSLMPGIFLWILSKLTRQVGTGDGYMVMITGCIFSIEDHIKMLVIAFFLAAGFVMGMVMVRRKIENRKIPFAPFLFIATTINLF